MASGQTNVDSSQETPAAPELRRYRVTRAHDGRAIGEELELAPDGHTQAMINLGHLSEA